jgi:hypothetical protein
MFRSRGADQDSLDIADAKPGQSAELKIYMGKTEDHAARGAKGFMALLNEGYQGVVGSKGFERSGGDASGFGRTLAMTDAINGGKEGAVGIALGDGEITGLDLITRSEGGDPKVDQSYFSCWS